MGRWVPKGANAMEKSKRKYPVQSKCVTIGYDLMNYDTASYGLLR